MRDTPPPDSKDLRALRGFAPGSDELQDVERPDVFGLGVRVREHALPSLAPADHFDRAYQQLGAIGVMMNLTDDPFFQLAMSHLYEGIKKLKIETFG